MRIWTWLAPSVALGASVLAGLFVGSSMPVAASAEVGDQIEDGVVECGAEFSVRPVIEPCYLELKRWTDAPPGSHDEEIADLLVNQTALLTLLSQALLSRALADGQLYDWSCAYCEIPGRCRMWLSGWEPGPQVQFNVVEDGRFLILQADLSNTVTLTVKCTDC